MSLKDPQEDKSRNSWYPEKRVEDDKDLQYINILPQIWKILTEARSELADALGVSWAKLYTYKQDSLLCKDRTSPRVFETHERLITDGLELTRSSHKFGGIPDHKQLPCNLLSTAEKS